MPVKFMAANDGSLRAIPEATHVSAVLTASSVDQCLYIADVPCEVVAVREVHETAGSDGGAVTLDIKKVTGTTAGTSGTSILASTFNLKSTAATVVTKNAASGLTATLANRKLDAGDRLFIDLTGTLTALAGGLVTVYIKKLRTAGGSL